jgi:hypothetical protein
MTTFRALCAELLQPLTEYDSANPYHEHRDLIDRASAELAKPEPEGPTSDELRAMAAEFAARTAEEFALAVPARWGRPAVAPEAGKLSPREVEAQEAFTEMRDEILSRSDGLGVNEVLSIIDSFTYLPLTNYTSGV